MDGQIIFVIWRESVEALLVIGILYNWLGREGNARASRGYLWGGVGAGLVVALALAFALMRLSAVFSGEAQEYLLTGMVFVAAILIVQMVAWMRAHGSGIKRTLEHGLDNAVRGRNLWGVFLLALLAVAREGSETVVFLYGILAGAHITDVLGLIGVIAVGFGAALATFAALQIGSRFMPWRRFFQISEAMLLLLGCALTVTGVGKLVALGLLPYGAPLWNTGWLLGDMGTLGGLIAALTGYRAQPDIVTLATWLGYWGVVALVLWRPWRQRPNAPRPTGANRRAKHEQG